MRVPGVVFVSRELLPDVRSDKSLEQVANVATLPGIVRASYARPDMHWGYGFPIGRLAATNVDTGGAVSPGGVGFDISCGVRFLAAPHLDRHGVASRLETAWMAWTAPSPSLSAAARCGVSAARPSWSTCWWAGTVRGRTRPRGDASHVERYRA